MRRGQGRSRRDPLAALSLQYDPYWRTLRQVVTASHAVQGPVASPAAAYFHLGTNRFPFGVFEKVARPARTGRNPRTGESVTVEEKWVPFFKTGKQLRERVTKASGLKATTMSNGVIDGLKADVVTLALASVLNERRRAEAGE